MNPQNQLALQTMPATATTTKPTSDKQLHQLKLASDARREAGTTVLVTQKELMDDRLAVYKAQLAGSVRALKAMLRAEATEKRAAAAASKQEMVRAAAAAARATQQAELTQQKAAKRTQRSAEAANVLKLKKAAEVAVEKFLKANAMAPTISM